MAAAVMHAHDGLASGAELAGTGCSGPRPGVKGASAACWVYEVSKVGQLGRIGTGHGVGTRPGHWLGTESVEIG